jgi:hypothetical protein
MEDEIHGHAARMGDINVYDILVGNPEGKIENSHCCKDNNI